MKINVFFILVIWLMFLSNTSSSQDSKFYLTHAQTASIMSISKINVKEKSDEQVIKFIVDDAINQRLAAKDSFSNEVKLIPIKESKEKEVTLKNDHQIIGEFLIEKDQLLTGNNNKIGRAHV